MRYTVPIFGLPPLPLWCPSIQCLIVFLPKSLWIVWWVDDWCYREINCLRTNSGFPLPGTTSRACQTSTKLSTTTTTIVLAANTSAVFLRTCHDHYQKPKRAVFPTQPNWCNDMRADNYAKIAHFKPQWQKNCNFANVHSLGIIDGHGVGVWGCAHPPKNQKSPNTPPCRRHGGCAPQCQRPGRKKNFDTPVGLFFVIFFAKSHPCLLIKSPTEKKFSHPGGKKILVTEGGRKFFL